MAKERLRVVESLAGVPAERWNALSQGDPFTSHEFLSALIDTGCASARSGWRPQIVLLEKDGHAGYELSGAMPLFLKSHSYGEYVFDWAWADAYQRHGLEYYPKLLCAVPFTPVTGPRLLAAQGADREKLALFDAVLDEVGSDARIIANTGTYDTAHSVHLTREARQAGVHGFLAVTPYYNKPPTEGLARHFAAIAAAADGLPVIIYNIPQRVIVNVDPGSMAQVAAAHPNVVAVKQSTPDTTQARAIPYFEAGRVLQIGIRRVRFHRAWRLWPGLVNSGARNGVSQAKAQDQPGKRNSHRPSL